MTRLTLLSAGAIALAGPALAHMDHTPHIHPAEASLLTLVAVGAMYALYRMFRS